jgi:hypothetical protein
MEYLDKEPESDPDVIVDEIYFSVDVEADGAIPGPFSMSSFGMVASAYRTKSGLIVDLDLDADENCLYSELKPISNMFEPEAVAVAGLDRNELILHGKTPEHAMLEAVEFVNFRTRNFGTNVRPIFAGYPLCYDWMWMYWYFMNFANISPFGHSGAIDMKSHFGAIDNIAIRRIGKRSLPPELKTKREHTHNALDDARGQGDLLQKLLRREAKSRTSSLIIQ